MKITEVKVCKFSVETGGAVFDPHTGEKVSSNWKSWLFLKIETDAGIHGWGDGSGEWLAAPVEAMINDYKPLLIGRDPTQGKMICAISPTACPGGAAPMDMAAADLSVECVAATRAAIGDDPAIMLDAHGSPSPELSIKYARRVAPYNPLFIEEPCKVGSIDALIAVSQASPVPIATGEKLFTIREFDEIIQRRACAYLQPDITHCYGISAFMEISANAAHQQMLIAPHNVAARSAAPQPFTLSPPSPLS